VPLLRILAVRLHREEPRARQIQAVSASQAAMKLRVDLPSMAAAAKRTPAVPLLRVARRWARGASLRLRVVRKTQEVQQEPAE